MGGGAGVELKPKGNAGAEDTELMWRVVLSTQKADHQTHVFLIQFGLSNNYGCSAFQWNILICCMQQHTAEIAVGHTELPVVEIFYAVFFLPARIWMTAILSLC